ncbi:hypothetical protein ACFPFV_02140 [Salinicoccus siamensis]|uniref:Nucleotidyltransferase-like protein n=1 Tax=Salinicoccus siamensis TaxID=381830 RepID=A0ABV5Z4G8_9STAP
MVKYLNDFEEYLNRNSLTKKDVCIVGSAALAVKGGRDNKDIDFIIRPSKLKKFKKFNKIPLNYSGHHEVENNIDIYKNRYVIVNIDDSMIFKRKLYKHYNGYNFVKAEIEIAYKNVRMRSKDIEDMKEINSISNSWRSLDWNYVDEVSKRYYSLTNYRKMRYKIDELVRNPSIIKFKIKKILNLENPKL